MPYRATPDPFCRPSELSVISGKFPGPGTEAIKESAEIETCDCCVSVNKDGDCWLGGCAFQDAWDNRVRCEPEEDGMSMLEIEEVEPILLSREMDDEVMDRSCVPPSPLTQRGDGWEDRLEKHHWEYSQAEVHDILMSQAEIHRHPYPNPSDDDADDNSDDKNRKDEGDVSVADASVDAHDDIENNGHGDAGDIDATDMRMDVIAGQNPTVLEHAGDDGAGHVGSMDNDGDACTGSESAMVLKSKIFQSPLPKARPQRRRADVQPRAAYQHHTPSKRSKSSPSAYHTPSKLSHVSEVVHTPSKLSKLSPMASDTPVKLSKQFKPSELSRAAYHTPSKRAPITNEPTKFIQRQASLERTSTRITNTKLLAHADSPNHSSDRPNTSNNLIKSSHHLVKTIFSKSGRRGNGVYDPHRSESSGHMAATHQQSAIIASALPSTCSASPSASTSASTASASASASASTSTSTSTSSSRSERPYLHAILSKRHRKSKERRGKKYAYHMTIHIFVHYVAGIVQIWCLSSQQYVINHFNII